VAEKKRAIGLRQSCLREKEGRLTLGDLRERNSKKDLVQEGGLAVQASLEQKEQNPGRGGRSLKGNATLDHLSEREKSPRLKHQGKTRLV